MEMRKAIVISFILLVLLCSVATISAETNKNLKIDGNTATFHGVKFNIPDGYEVSEDESIDKNNQMQSGDDEKMDGFVLKDKNEHTINVYVGYGDNYTPQDAMEGSEIITINGVEGSIEDLGGTGTLLFSYIYDGNIVYITGNEDTLKEMVVDDGKEKDTNDVSVDGDTVTVHGEKFNIPKGFKLSYKDQDNETTLCYLVKDVGDGGGIMIQVDYDQEYGDEILKLKAEGFEGKTINNIDGMLVKLDESDSILFMYPSNGNKVSIVVENEDQFKQVLP